MRAAPTEHDERREFDVRCWELLERGYSVGYIASFEGVSVHDVDGAIRRVRCGRYGSVGTDGSRD